MVRPNPRYDPVTGAVTIPTEPKEPRPNPRYGNNVNEFVLIDGYSRNLQLEAKLAEDIKIAESLENMGYSLQIPNWWIDQIDPSQGWYGKRVLEQSDFEKVAHESLIYLDNAKKIMDIRVADLNYKCHNYPKDTSFCQNAIHLSGVGSLISQAREKIKKDLKLDWRTYDDFGIKNKNRGKPFLTYTPTQPTQPIIEEPIIELPELLPEAAAQIDPIPIITPEINDSISTNMITQQVINFNIVNGRAVGSIRFIATENFNPYYYGKNLINIVQFKTPNGVNILPYVKQNNLRFTETERDEVINYDEDMKGNTRAIVESFVWEWMDKPAGAFSNKYMIEISEPEPPKVIQTGIMGAGVGGAIGILILLGFLADSRRKK